MMATIDPLLIDLPPPLASERLLLRAPCAGDGAALNEAVVDSIVQLKPWMPWAQTKPSVEQTELVCRQMAARFAQRSDLPLFIFARGSGRLVGGTGLHRFDWSVPRFEIGYWVRRSGRGLVTEAVQTLIRFAFGTLHARRVEVRMSSAN
jgi:ribosomal-protein-serine acetyltransferase